ALVVTLIAGVWVDRLTYRSVLLVADFGRVVLLISIPIAALLGVLRVEQLYAVGFGAGCFEILFSLADRSILPQLVDADHLVEANARLRVTEALAETTSPTLGGAVVQVAGAPIAVLLDALSFLASGLALTRLLSRRQTPTGNTPHLRRDLIEGLRTATGDPVLRAILGMTAIYGFFGSFLITLFALRILDQLHISPVALGLIAAAGGIGSLAGSSLVGRLDRRLGAGRSITLAYLLATLFDLSVPLAAGPRDLAFAVLLVGMFLSSIFYAVENIASLSLRQALTPAPQMGRVNAVFLVANRALRPLGALAAGALAEALGVRSTLFIGWAGIVAAGLLLFLSPLPTLSNKHRTP
ncbi:MAG TPA: MFS transporter, partial [Dehalococcoidia bacterium]|nr:MFS transporter [Dehalococcoidia bacterium]